MSSSSSSAQGSSHSPAFGTSRPPLGHLGHARHSSASVATFQWTEHQYSLSDNRNPPWAVLMVRSRAASPAHLPSIFEKEDITGVFSLNLSREESIKAVVVSIIGQITTSVIEVRSFLSLSQELWSSESSQASSGGKLCGRHRWTFSFTMPPTTELINPDDAVATYRMPPSFSERTAKVHIQYQIIARVRRGKFRPDSHTVFSFTPFLYPDPFSEARQAAYRFRRPLPGPDQDSEGWITLHDFDMRGTLQYTRAVAAVCRLSLAKPLAYTRGTIIPCSLCVECSDSQVLGHIVTPDSLDIRLFRHVVVGFTKAGALSTAHSTNASESEETSHEIKSAVWWLNMEHPHQRTFSGEIHLAKDLKPSCHFGNFEIYYTVNMYSLKVPAYSPQVDTSTPLQSQRVEVVTAYASGPRPRMYSPNSPAGHNDVSSSRPSLDFSTHRG